MGSVAAHSPPLVRAHSTSGRRALLFSALALGAVLVILFFLGVFERIAYAGDVMPGVRVQGVGDVDIASKHETDAYVELAALAQRLESQPLRARIGGKEVVADASILRVDVDQYATLQAARRAGRSGNPIEQTLGTVLRRVRPDEVPLRIHYDEAGLQGLLDGWSRPVAAGGVEGALRFQGTQVVEVYPQRGIGLQRDKAERLLLDEMRTTARKPVTLPVGAVNARVSRAEVDAAAAKARAALNGNHVVRTPTASLTITPEQLVTALGTRIDGHSLDLTIDQTKLRAALGPSLAPLETPAIEASFRITPANTVEVVPAANGRAVDLDRVARDILAGKHTIDARIAVAAPQRTTAWAQSLGIKREVSSFTTHHNAGEDRVQNIHR